MTMILSDTHIHSSFSSDSDSPMEEMILSAINKGLERICFTEHLDLDFPKEYGIDFSLDIDGYFSVLQELTEKYSKTIDINFGIEIGMIPYLASDYDRIIKKYDFDYVICSSHLVNMKDPYYPDYWRDKSFDDGCREYFRTIIDNINAYDNFDSYGHLDYIIRYGIDRKYIEFDRHRDIIDEILRLLIHKHKALELNCAGYKYGLNAPNPSPDIIRRYLELGGELITIGSDAHEPSHMAYNYTELEGLLQSCGIKKYHYYKNRKPCSVDIS